MSDDYAYPHHGTCDGCAQGDRPLREADPESQAWICAECDALHEQGVRAAALVLDDEAGYTTVPTIDIARRALDAYFAATDRASRADVAS